MTTGSFFNSVITVIGASTATAVSSPPDSAYKSLPENRFLKPTQDVQGGTAKDSEELGVIKAQALPQIKHERESER
jgi:hypothetical protein